MLSLFDQSLYVLSLFYSGFMCAQFICVCSVYFTQDVYVLSLFLGRVNVC